MLIIPEANLFNIVGAQLKSSQLVRIFLAENHFIFLCLHMSWWATPCVIVFLVKIVWCNIWDATWLPGVESKKWHKQTEALAETDFSFFFIKTVYLPCLTLDSSCFRYIKTSNIYCCCHLLTILVTHTFIFMKFTEIVKSQ